jgi:hypothetical protein
MHCIKMDVPADASPAYARVRDKLVAVEGAKVNPHGMAQGAGRRTNNPSLAIGAVPGKRRASANNLFTL